MNTETGESPAPQSPALDLSGFSGWHGAPSLGQGPPMAIRQECGSEVGKEVLCSVLHYTAVSWSSRWIIW